MISRKLSTPNAGTDFFIRHALRAGMTIDEIFNLTKIDRWFLTQIKEIVDFEEVLAATKTASFHQPLHFGVLAVEIGGLLIRSWRQPAGSASPNKLPMKQMLVGKPFRGEAIGQDHAGMAGEVGHGLNRRRNSATS